MRTVRCELCGRGWTFSDDKQCEEFWLKHLDTHSKEEVEKLRQLAILAIKDPDAYAELSFQVEMLGVKKDGKKKEQMAEEKRETN